MKQRTVWFFLILAAGLALLPGGAGATAPVASFTANVTSGGIPLGVQFIDISTNSPTSWVWSFGDGATSPEKDPVHAYTAAGTYTVTLTATNADGSATVTKSGYITLSKSASAPVASFLANITSGSQPLAIQFVDSSANSPTAWAWSFGDGGTSASQNPSHTYTTTGSFTVTLSAVNAAGSSTVSREAYVTVASTSSAPAASFRATGTSGSCPLTVQFIDTSTNSPTSWVWSFGDGGTTTSQNPSHTYAAAGTYSVTMTATNAGGSSTANEVDYITVDETEPVASFTANSTAGTPPLAVQFTDTSSNAPTIWYWYFGDGGYSTDENPVHEYDEAGSYTVTLTATNDAGGNTTTVAKYINVTAITPPEPLFTASITTGTAPLDVQFTDTSLHSPTAWEWSFGDGTTSTLQNPKHQYASAGQYSVTLTVSNSGGTRTATTSNYIVVTSAGVPVAAVADTPATAETADLTMAPTAQPAATSSPKQAASYGDGSATPMIIAAILIFAGVGAIGFLLMRRRPPRGQSHLHRRDL